MIKESVHIRLLKADSFMVAFYVCCIVHNFDVIEQRIKNKF